MASGSKTTIKDFFTGTPDGLARVVNGRLLVSGTGGGVGTDVNIDAVGGNPVGATVPVNIVGPVTVDEPVTVDGTVVVSSITNPVTIAEPVTVDGTVVVSSITNPVTIAEPVTVDGTVVVSSITNPVTIAEPVTVDGTVNIGGQPIQVTNPITHALLLGQMKIEDEQGTFASPGKMAAVRADTDSLATDNTRDAGIAITLPSTQLPEVTGSPFDKTNGARMLYTDDKGNLSVGAFIRGRAQSAVRILDVVNEEETFGSDPFGETDVRGAMVAGVCQAAPESSPSPEGNFSFLRLDLQRRLWVRLPGDVVNTIAFSESDGGSPIQIGATASPGTLIHQVEIDPTLIDRIYLDLTNTSDNSVLVTVQLGGTAAGDSINDIVPARGTIRKLVGSVLRGDASVVRELRVFAATTNVINAFGRVERISQ